MAAALLEYHVFGRLEVRSAGSSPAESVNAVAVEALGEWGIDISGRTPTALTTAIVHEADVVVSMGCGDACPVFPGKQYIEWELTDPHERDLEAVRSIRDNIDRRVRALASELLD